MSRAFGAGTGTCFVAGAWRNWTCSHGRASSKAACCRKSKPASALSRAESGRPISSTDGYRTRCSSSCLPTPGSAPRSFCSRRPAGLYDSRLRDAAMGIAKLVRVRPIESTVELVGQSRPSAGTATVADIMTRNVAPIRANAPIDQAARRLALEGLPGLHQILADSADLARDYCRAVGATVGEVMRSPAITVSPDLAPRSAALLFETASVSLLPVVSVGSGERLEGVLTRRDLIKALIPAPPPPVQRSDAQLIEAMRARMADETWISSPRPSVFAHNGVLELWGLVGSEQERAALETMARTLPGCVGVD